MNAGYDNIHLWIPERPGNTSLITNWVDHKDSQEHTWKTGHLGNIRVSISDGGTSFKGSFPRYLHGSNCIELTLSETKEVISCISEALWIPIEDAKVTYLEFGQNIFLDYPPETYYPYLGHCPHLNRIAQPRSLSYQNGTRQFIFYNKKAEAKKNAPENWKGHNVMRVETRKKKEPHKRLKRLPITGATLFDKDFFKSMQDHFVSEYHSIKKIPTFHFNLDSMRKPTDLFNQLLSERINEIGLETALQIVDELKERNQFANRRAYYDAKKKIIELNEMRDVSMLSPLIDELNRKIDDHL